MSGGGGTPLAEEQLSRAGLEVARGIVEGMSDPAILLDLELGHLSHSAAYAAMVGMRSRALVRSLDAGARVFDLLGSTGNDDEERARACLESRKAQQFAEVSVVNANGERLTAYVTFNPIVDAAGEVLGLIQSFRDVSAEARVQKRYRDLLEQERLRGDELERRVEQRTMDLRAALDEVTRLSRVDPLTSLLNRRAFTELAEQSLKMARRHNRSVGLLIGDLDLFKKVNDTFGHQAGDALLVATSAVLRASVRDTDPVARFGGEEFVILLTETLRDAVEVVGERIRSAVEALGPDELGPDSPRATISVGMAIFPDHGVTLDELVSKADQALYRAKTSGRNRVEMYDPDRVQEGVQSERSDKRQILLVASSRASLFRSAIGDSYEVVDIADSERALEDAEHIRYDAIVSDHESAELGVDFLRRSLRHRGESLRVLVIDSQEVFCEIRGSNLARIDSFLLRDEAPEHLTSAIDDALARREQDRQRVLMKSDSVQRLFASRLSELEALIANREFEFAYQPIVNPRSGAIFAHEALCRAVHPIFCNALVLFDAAVQSGNLWALGRVTRELAVRNFGPLSAEDKIFVNLHPGEIEDPELLGDATTRGDRIIFEITERAAIPDFKRFRETAKLLSRRGFQFAIDDLGAGYSSLNAVALLAPEFIKIDMTMVRSIHTAPRRQQLIRRMVDFANDIGIRLIAEGVETEVEANVIAELGCHLAQGYYYGRPAIRRLGI